MLLLVLPFEMAAQATGSIYGKVIDGENDEPLGFVTVALIPEGSTIPVAGCSTDDDGSFELTNIKDGRYTLNFSYVGYLNDSRSVSIAKTRNDIGVVKLKSDRRLATNLHDCP